jgi:hypothetical protein
MIGWHSNYSAGALRMMADRPSLGIDPSTEVFFCTFVGNPPGDTSAAGYPNGEIFVACSEDRGLNWWPAINLTNTPSPGCTPGNCEDDDYPSLAEITDDNLHILYVNDKDAGGIPFGEGNWTLNPVLYLKVPSNILHCVVGSEEKENQEFQSRFWLSQNTPNPFNKLTAISFQLKAPSQTTLKVYDIAGREVANLFEGEMKVGYHTLHWDGSDNNGKKVSSGIYFYRLTVQGNVKHPYTHTRKMIILR